MSLAIRTNLAALQTTTELQQNRGRLTDTLGRVASGLRIRRSADDSAGLSLATNHQTQAMGAAQGIRNASDGLSIIQTAEGALSTVADLLTRMRALGVQAASDTTPPSERAYIRSEFLDLRREIRRVGEDTEFNGIPLLNGSRASLEVQVGTQNTTRDRISIDLTEVSFSALNLVNVAGSSATVGLTIMDISEAALDTINRYRSTLGAVHNRLTSAMHTAEHTREACTAAESTIRDADLALETSRLTRLQIMESAAIAATSQTEAMQRSVLQLLVG